MRQAVDSCIMALQYDNLCFWVIMNIKVFAVFTVEGAVELSAGSGERK